MTLWLFPLALIGWLAASLLIGWVLGLVLRRNTGDPPPHAGDLLDLEDIDWRWPRRDVA